MVVANAWVAHCLELLSTQGRARARRMFGGHGFYIDDLFVGLLDEAPRFNPKEVAQVAWLSPGEPEAHDPLTPWSALYVKLFGFDVPRRRALRLDGGAVQDGGPVFQL